MPAAMVIGGGAIAAVGASKQRKASKIAQAAANAMASASNKQFDAEQRKAEIENIRTLRTNVRQARLARASIIYAAANTGTLASSGAQGGVSSVSAQQQADVSTFTSLSRENQVVLSAQREQAAAQAQAGVAQAKSSQAGALMSLGTSIMAMSGGIKTIFS